MVKSYSPKFKVGDVIIGYGDSVVLKVLKVEKVHYILQFLIGNIKIKTITVENGRGDWGIPYIDGKFKLAKKEYQLLYG